MGRDCAPAGLPPRSDARSGLSVTPAAGSVNADDPAHRVETADERTCLSPSARWLGEPKIGKFSAVPVRPPPKSRLHSLSCARFGGTLLRLAEKPSWDRRVWA